MGVDIGDYDNSGRQGVAITNFDNEMLGLYRSDGKGNFSDVAVSSGVGLPSKTSLGFGCAFADCDLDGSLDLIVVNGHIDDTVRSIRNVGYAQPPQLFLNNDKGSFREVGGEAGGGFSSPKVGRGLAIGDFDRDGDADILMTTNNGPVFLFRNDQTAGNHSIRFKLIGTKSNRDAIGARVTIFSNGASQTRMVKSGSSYLSQSELPVTFGVGKNDRIERVVIDWPNGAIEDFKDLAAGKMYQAPENKGLKSEPGF
jgi:ASPIC and UnbV./FG-GAP repeat.